MLRTLRIGLVLFGLLVVVVQSATADVYVLRMGDGAAPLTNTPVSVATFVDKYSDAGSLISSIALPTALAGANHPLTETPNSTSIGHMALSTDGQYLTMGGIDAVPGTANARQGTTGRVFGRVKISDGSVDTSTSLSDAYPGSTNNNNDIRSVVSTDGTNFWSSGTSFPTTGANAGQGGVQYATLGATTGTRMSVTPTNTRVANIFNNQLYMSSASGAFVGVSTVGTGLEMPVSDDLSNTTLVVGTGTGSSPYDFWFKDASTLYVADDRIISSGGGLQKYTFDGSAWSLAYTLNTGITNGLRGLDGAIVGGDVVLYASTVANSTDGTAANAIVKVTDTGAGSAFSTVLSAATNTTVRGVVYVPGAAGITGDYNGNGIVDGADYVVWRNNPAGFGGDPAGYNTWRSNFGDTSGSGSGLGGSAAVPEPATAVLLLFGFAGLCLRRRSA